MNFQSLQVHDIFSRQLAAELAARLRVMSTKGWHEDEDVPGSFAKLRAFDEYLEPLSSLVAQALDCDVVPVRSYARIYVKDSVLRPHVDKDEIPYGVSLCLARGPHNWPFKVGEQEYIDRVGSGIIYDGLLRHYRRGKAPGEQVQVFLHYARKA